MAERIALRLQNDSGTIRLPQSVPLFPLPDHVFMPGLASPYRVFEPRYVTLVEDLLDSPAGARWLAIPRLTPGWERDESGAPAIESVATVGRMVSCRELPDGHYVIAVSGEERCLLQEVAAETPYRQAEIIRWPDVPTGTGLSDRARSRGIDIDFVFQLASALASSLGADASTVRELLDEEQDPEMTVYRIAALMIDEPDARQAFLETRSPGERMEIVADALATALALSVRQDSPQSGGTAQA